ncbi:hypothetical protein G9A89_009187 [Geosiphon pyriformis]|nr:hypothetical protein G9A89_009187 [Geosiphon pyriformis]
MQHKENPSPLHKSFLGNSSQANQRQNPDPQEMRPFSFYLTDQQINRQSSKHHYNPIQEHHLNHHGHHHHWISPALHTNAPYPVSSSDSLQTLYPDFFHATHEVETTNNSSRASVLTLPIINQNPPATPPAAMNQIQYSSSRQVISRSVSDEERAHRRLERNRLAAKACRERKRAYISALECRVSNLDEENEALREAIQLAKERHLGIASVFEENTKLRWIVQRLREMDLYTTA